jgi:transcriptional regulator with XRE-family HTH domain
MITDRQVRAARALLAWKQEDLARASGLSLATIQNVERGADVRLATLRKIKLAFTDAGLTFTAGEGIRRSTKEEIR